MKHSTYRHIAYYTAAFLHHGHLVTIANNEAPLNMLSAPAPENQKGKSNNDKTFIVGWLVLNVICAAGLVWSFKKSKCLNEHHFYEGECSRAIANKVESQSKQLTT